MRAERTPAKIGRLMKNCESFMISTHHVKSDGGLRKTRDGIDRTCRCLGGYLGKAAGGIAHGNARSCDPLAGPDMLQTVDDDELVRRKALRHDAQAVDFRSELHEAI